MAYADQFFFSRPARYLTGSVAILVLTWFFHLSELTRNQTTCALGFLIVILLTATFHGRNPALLTSFTAMLCFNLFFLPPFGTLRIVEPHNLVVWAAFTVTAIIAGELSAYASRRAEEAERNRDELVLLNEEAREAFEQAAKVEAAEQGEILKSALLDALTHDMRTPLTAIKASVTTLIDQNKNYATGSSAGEFVGDLLSIIDEETDRLTDFNQSLFEIARIEGGALTVRDERTAPAEAITAAVERCRKNIIGRTVRLEIGEEVSDAAIEMQALTEAVFVLLENALKYSPPSEFVTITAKNSGADVRICVIDRGATIPSDVREKMFEKFYRGRTDTKGLGLGLAIAKGIIEAYGGSLVLEDHATVGNRFVITLKGAP
jgi:two-component system sensor histidine kinase KdpD